MKTSDAAREMFALGALRMRGVGDLWQDVEPEHERRVNQTLAADLEELRAEDRAIALHAIRVLGQDCELLKQDVADRDAEIARLRAVLASALAALEQAEPLHDTIQLGATAPSEGMALPGTRPEPGGMTTGAPHASDRGTSCGSPECSPRHTRAEGTGMRAAAPGSRLPGSREYGPA